MAQTDAQPAAGGPAPQAIIAGFGIPGRFVGELLDSMGIAYRVIDVNPATAQRCRNVSIIAGDVRDERVLREAGIERASLLILAVPIEDVVLQAVEVARRLRPDIRIFARVNYTSSGLAARKLGAEQVVVAEQLVAREFFRVMQDALGEGGNTAEGGCSTDLSNT